MSTTLRILAAALLLRAGAAESQEWVRLGPDGGQTVSIVDGLPGTGALSVSTGRTGIFRSLDGGESWSASNDGLPTLATGKIVRVTEGALLVGTYPGLSRSADGGAHWASVAGFPATLVNDLTVDPRFSNIVYAVTTGGLYRSRDAGIEWAPLTFSGYSTGPISVDPQTSRIYLGAGGCPYASSDLGATWQALGCVRITSPISLGPAVVLSALAPDPHASSVLFAGAVEYSYQHARAAGGVFRSDDSGATFRDVSPPHPVSVLSLAWSGNGDLLAGTADGVLVTQDGGASWSSLGLSGFAVNGILPESGGVIVASTAARGVFVSRDGGAHWTSSNRGLRSVAIRSVAIDPRTPSTIWAGGLDVGGGLWKSVDGGATWESRDGFPSDSTVDILAVDPASPRRIFAGGSRADSGFSISDLYLSEDDGTTWSSKLFSGFPYLQGIAFDARDRNRIFSGFQLGLYESADAGETWSLRTLESSGGVCADPQDPLRLYTANFRSSDGGVTWTPFGPPSGNVAAVAVGAAGRVFAAGQGVFRSDDFGETFQPASIGITARSIGVLTADPPSARVFALPIYGSPAGTRVFETADAGLTWSAADEGLPAADVWALAIDSASGWEYAGAVDGVYRRIEASRGCEAAPTVLCLGGGRFRAQISFDVTESLAAHALPLTSDAGAFWFFSANNLEVVVKVVDGAAVNGHFWVFGAGLTDVEYDLAITDTTTGEVWTRHNTPGTLASFADTSAF